MKMNKKKSFSLALVIALIAILSFSSLAWFNDTEEVTNNFYVATSGTGTGDDSTTADNIFSVDVWETEDKDGDNDLDDDNDGNIDNENKDQNGQQFNNIVPGGKYVKNPYVENTGSYDQWIRASVKITDGAAWDAILGTGYDLSKILVGLDTAKWIEADKIYVTAEDAWVYYYYYNTKLAPGAEVALFTDIQIPNFLDQEDMAKLAGGFDITVKAEALQADNTGNTAKEAFETTANWACGAEYVEPAK